MAGVVTVTVGPAESGMKLLLFLEARLGKGVPRAAIQKWIRTGQVRVDGGRAKPFDRLSAGQSVRIPPHEPGETAPERLKASGPPLEILYEDAETVVVKKPRGLAAQGGTGLSDSVADRLLAMYAGTGVSPAPVHRLDRETTGILVAGKTHEARRRLSEIFAGREAQKTYLVWVAGRWPEERAVTLSDRLEKAAAGKGLEKVRAGAGRQALARVRPLRLGERASLLAVELFTGRTHQIRVQLATRGHPVLGDRKYGAPPHATPLMLHAWRLELPGLPPLVCAPDWDGEWAP